MYGNIAYLFDYGADQVVHLFSASNTIHFILEDLRNVFKLFQRP